MEWETSAPRHWLDTLHSMTKAVCILFYSHCYCMHDVNEYVYSQDSLEIEHNNSISLILFSFPALPRKSRKCFPHFARPWKVLVNGFSHRNSWKLMLKVLESYWIYFCVWYLGQKSVGSLYLVILSLIIVVTSIPYVRVIQQKSELLTNSFIWALYLRTVVSLDFIHE